MSWPRQPLAQRVLGDERLELADELRVAAEREVGVDPLLERREAELLEPDDRGLRERLVGEVGERGAAPERERLAQRRRGRSASPAGAVRLALAEQALEAVQVELLGLELERVAGRARDEHAAPSDLAQARRRSPGAPGFALPADSLAPELVDQAVGRDDLHRAAGARTASTARCWGPPSGSGAPVRPVRRAGRGSGRRAPPPGGR